MFYKVMIMMLALWVMPITMAFAQEAGTVVDFSDTIIAVITLAAAALGVVGMWLWQKFSGKYGLDKLIAEEKVREMVDKVLDEAVNFGAGKIKGADWAKVDTKNEAVAIAANYAINHGGDLLEKAGLSGDMLIEKLESKMLKQQEAQVDIVTPTVTG